MASLERLSDPYGSVVLGWISPNVFYTRLEQTLSADLGARFAQRFTTLIGDTVAVHYFNDCSAATSYDLVAYTRIVDGWLQKREHFKLMVLLPWSGTLGARARALPTAFECLEYVSSDAEFQARLHAAAPDARLLGLTPRVESTSDTDNETTCRARLDAEATPALPPAENIPKGGSFTYVFDLSDFEQGRFTATRFEYLAARPRAAWTCVARNDQQALALARQAALVEWSPPLTREPEAFTVRFIDPPSASTFDRRH